VRASVRRDDLLPAFITALNTRRVIVWFLLSLQSESSLVLFCFVLFLSSNREES
jgi:hypothetical protein